MRPDPLFQLAHRHGRVDVLTITNVEVVVRVVVVVVVIIIIMLGLILLACSLLKVHNLMGMARRPLSNQSTII